MPGRGFNASPFERAQRAKERGASLASIPHPSGRFLAGVFVGAPLFKNTHVGFANFKGAMLAREGQGISLGCGRVP